MAKYGNYAKKNTPSGPPNTFTARITVPGKDQPVFRPYCKIQWGVVVQLISVGMGKKIEKAYWSPEGDADVVEEWDYYAYVPSPLFCSAKFTDEAEKQSAMALYDTCAKKKDWRPCFDQYKHAMLTMGDNGNGYKVEDDEQARKEAILREKKVELYPGFRGVKMIQRLPTEIWSKLKPYATFYTRDQVEEWYEDMDDFHLVDTAKYEAGWNYDLAIIAILKQMGWRIEYRDVEIHSEADMALVDKRLAEEEAERNRRYQEQKKREEALVTRFRALVNWELMDKADTAPVLELPQIRIKALRWNGGNIHGGGYWGKQDNTYLYEISNNSMDGDDWSRNNSREGIVWRTPLTDELRIVLQELIEFDKQA